MDTLYPLLISQGILGIFWIVVLFVVSFICIHLAKLVKLGWASTQAPPKPEPKQEEKPAEKEKPPPAPEPVYYIVERKKVKRKQSYGEPREIRFK